MLLSQWSYDFIQKMKNRIQVGWCRYGQVDDVRLCDYLNFAKARIQKYEDTHNTECLVDAANMLMLEFQYPGFLDAHFKCDNQEGSAIEKVTK